MQDYTHEFSPNSFAKHPCASHGNGSRKNARLLLQGQSSQKHHKEGSFPSYNDRERSMPKWLEKTLPCCNVLLVLSLEMKRHVLKGEKHAKMVLPFCNVLLVLSLEMKRPVLNGCRSVVHDVLARLVHGASQMPSSMCVSPWNFEIWRESHCLRLGWWAHPRRGASRSAQPNLPLQVCVFMLEMACLVHGASRMSSSTCVSP